MLLPHNDVRPRRPACRSGYSLRTISCALCFLFVSVHAFGQDRLLWEVQEDFNGGVDLARAVTLSKRTAVVVGTAGSADGGLDFVIRSFRKSTGVVQWSDHIPSCCGASPVVVTSLRDRVFAAGYVAGPTAGSTDVVVRAYDAPTGALLWQNVWDTGRDDLPQAIAASPTAVVAVGYGGNTPGHSLDLIVRAYDPISGVILWEDQVDRGNVDDAAWAVAIGPQRVFIAATTSTPSGRDLLVRAYTAWSGLLNWETTRPATTPVALKVIAGRLFLAGSSSNNTYLGAFEAKSGALLWEDKAPVPGLFRDLDVAGQQVIAAGSSGTGLLVRALDVRTGTLAWQDRPVELPGFGALGFAIAANRDAVYVVGSAGRDFQYSEVMVRAYDTTGGALLWDDRSHRNLTSAAVDVALGLNRLFVAGYTTGVRSDFLIRAYRIGHDGAAPAVERNPAVEPSTSQ
jgi:hypothetical protein